MLALLAQLAQLAHTTCKTGYICSSYNHMLHLH